jgi:hypothetical protein
VQQRKQAATNLQQQGFSFVEMIMACGVLMVGIVSVVQLVPASLKTSVNNRLDTMATAVAQRELDQMLSQPFTRNSFTDADGHSVNLGGPGEAGANAIMDGQSAAIDFSADISTVPNGFSALYIDRPADPDATTFELRWRVFTEVSGTTVISRRIIVGCRRFNSNTGVFPVSLDSSVQRF